VAVNESRVASALGWGCVPWAIALSDLEAQSRVAALENSLRELGWVKGRNLSIEYRWAGNSSVVTHESDFSEATSLLAKSRRPFPIRAAPNYRPAYR